MSGLVKNFGGFHAQGTEINGRGVSEEQTTFGTIVVANGTSGTPAQIAAAVQAVLASGHSALGLSR
jgi:hypothetical protein